MEGQRVFEKGVAGGEDAWGNLLAAFRAAFAPPWRLRAAFFRACFLEVMMVGRVADRQM